MPGHAQLEVCGQPRDYKCLLLLSDSCGSCCESYHDNHLDLPLMPVHCKHAFIRRRRVWNQRKLERASHLASTELRNASWISNLRVLSTTGSATSAHSMHKPVQRTLSGAGDGASVLLMDSTVCTGMQRAADPSQVEVQCSAAKSFLVPAPVRTGSLLLGRRGTSFEGSMEENGTSKKITEPPPEQGSTGLNDGRALPWWLHLKQAAAASMHSAGAALKAKAARLALIDSLLSLPRQCLLIVMVAMFIL